MSVLLKSFTPVSQWFLFSFSWFLLICAGLCLQVLELTKEWTNKWNETQNILKVRAHVCLSAAFFMLTVCGLPDQLTCA